MKLKNIISAALSCCMLLGCGLTGGFIREETDSAAQKSRVSVHDPSIFKDKNGTYYVFGSHLDAARSKDMQNWTLFTNGYTTQNNTIFGDLSQNLKGAFAWAGEDLEDCEGGFAVWAPDVLYNPDYVNTNGTKGAYMMYFCTSSTYMRSVIGFAVSQNAAGPYTFVDTLIYSGFTSGDSYATSSTKNVNRKYTSTNIDELINAGQVTYNENWFRNGGYNNQLFPNAIDPTVYYDAEGKMHMCYGSWSGGIFTLELDPATGKCIHPRSGETSDGRMIDSYFGTKISGGFGKSGEAPYIRYNPDNGYYYLWVTYGGLTAEGGYNMRVFRSKSPDGPFTDPAGRQAVLNSDTSLDSVGLKVMGNYKFGSISTAYMAPGHNSVLRNDDGNWYLFNHTRFNGGTEYHEVRVHQIFFNRDGWCVTAPYEYSGDTLCEYGYNESDIVGEYELIDHGTDTSKNIRYPVKVKLNSDGTISGDASGTWSQSKYSADAVITIGGQVYSGVFFACEDESGTNKTVMTFTAVGNNNHSIWGVQSKRFAAYGRDPITDYSDPNSKLVYAPETAVGDSAAKYLSGTPLLSGVSYYITNKNSRLLLEVEDGKTSPGTNIQQWEMNIGPHHEWRINALDEDYCRISLMSDESMCVTVDGSSAENGLNVMLSPYTGADNQLFRLIKDGTSYAIVSKCSGDKACLDVYEWSTENGGNVNQWEYWGGDCQLWNITPVYPAVNEGNFALRSLYSGKYLTHSAANVSMGSRTAWEFVPLGDGTYAIKTPDGKALTADENNIGEYVAAYGYTGSPEQRFTLKCREDGSYFISSVHFSGKNLQTGTYDGVSLYHEISLNADMQKFILEPIQPANQVKGDVNADGEFSVADLVMMHNFILRGTPLTDPGAGDVAPDEKLNIFDVIAMRKMLLGLM